MRVLIAAFPLASHLYPLVPLAWALQSAGHTVTVATQPGLLKPDMTEMAAGAGLTVVPLGVREDLLPMGRARLSGQHPELAPDALAVDPEHLDDWRTTRAGMAFQWAMNYALDAPADGGRPVVDHLVDLVRDTEPDLVLWDPLCFPAAMAARAAGVAHGRVLFGNDNVAHIRALSLADCARTGTDPAHDPLITWMDPLLRRHGLDYTEEILLGQWTVDILRTGRRARHDLPGLTYLPVRAVPYNGSTVLPPWLVQPPRSPRVCLTLGQTSRPLVRFGRTDVSVADLIAAAEGLDIELVATLNADQLAQVGRLPDNVRVIDYLPLNAVLPSCAAIVHHGGAGTVAAAVAHRVPQVIVPNERWDEISQARYIAERGAGLVLPPTELTPDALREKLQQVLCHPWARQGAHRLHQDTLSAPTPAELVPTLERLAARPDQPLTKETP
ncbi:nucleotide disphospho-sugar-binding domain-containing protein [Streptomyces sp. NPDC019224]|uniref:nucleotide disphospho-sugar-binding domain-containing protein n=1 Tax=Streptomyces sp. NPDC019224 TaxID=3154484 RepID=UPI0033DFA959